MPTPSRVVLATFTVLATLSIAAPARAALYDLAGDWSDVDNGTGGNPWSYRGGASALPAQADLGGYPYTQPGWAPSLSAGSFLPMWFKAAGNPGDPALDIVAGDIVTHTWDSGNGGLSGLSNILFTAPYAGIATISGSVFNSRNLNRPQQWDLLVNDVVQAGDTLPGNGTYLRGSAATFNLTGIALDAGDTIEMLFTATGTFGDFVTLAMSVDLVPAPEPATLVLLGSGLVALGLGRRRSAA